jgi:hypothetical protein
MFPYLVNSSFWFCGRIRGVPIDAFREEYEPMSWTVRAKYLLIFQWCKRMVLLVPCSHKDNFLISNQGNFENLRAVFFFFRHPKEHFW